MKNKCRYVTEDSKTRVYLVQVKRSNWRRAGRILKYVAPVICRVLVAALITYIYAVWTIDQAYIKRGYMAYGGEYMLIPFVFYVTYRIIALISWLCRLVKRGIERQQYKRKGGYSETTKNRRSLAEALRYENAYLVSCQSTFTDNHIVMYAAGEIKQKL